MAKEREREKKEQLLVHGCGPLAIGRRVESMLGGTRCEGGYLPAEIVLQGGDGSSAVTVTLSDVLDRERGWLPGGPLPDVRIQVSRGGAKSEPLQAWADLASLQVTLAAKELGGSGVLVTPETWRESSFGYWFLWQWWKAGWTWASFEEVLREHFGGGVRFVSSGGVWLRVNEPGGSAVIPNGAEAATALRLVKPILEKALGEVDGALAQRWRLEEQPRSGWFTWSAIVHGVMKALQSGSRDPLVLGGPGAPIFLFSSHEITDVFRELAELRLEVDLPTTWSGTLWWEEIAKPGFLEAPAGTIRRPSFDWKKLETILIDPAVDAASDVEALSIRSFLKARALRFRAYAPSKLDKALDFASSLEGWLERQRDAKKDIHAPTLKPRKQHLEKAPKAARSAPKRMPADKTASGQPERSRTNEEVSEAKIWKASIWATETFEPEFMVLPDEGVQAVKIMVDSRLFQGDWDELPNEGGRTGYKFGDPVRYGAIVRVDYELENEEAA